MLEESPSSKDVFASGYSSSAVEDDSALRTRQWEVKRMKKNQMEAQKAAAACVGRRSQLTIN